ncbi:MAG: hypothetical protein AAF184_20990 [Pseudomonadota bacterium]
MNEPRYLIGCVLSLILLQSLQHHAGVESPADTVSVQAAMEPAASRDGSEQDERWLDDPLQADVSFDALE